MFAIKVNIDCRSFDSNPKQLNFGWNHVFFSQIGINCVCGSWKHVRFVTQTDNIRTFVSPLKKMLAFHLAAEGALKVIRLLKNGP